METEAVQRIYAQHVIKTNENDAVALAHKEIAENIFAETANGQSFDAEAWETILKTIEAQSIMCYFWPLRSGSVSVENIQLYRNLGFLFTAWADGIKYVLKHYDSLDEKIQQEYSTERLQKIIDSIEICHQQKALEGAETGVVKVEKEIFKSMYSAYALVLNIILGYEVYEKFKNEVNKSISLLNNCHMSAITLRSNSIN